jgi:hypothetical protein
MRLREGIENLEGITKISYTSQEDNPEQSYIRSDIWTLFR